MPAAASRGEEGDDPGDVAGPIDSVHGWRHDAQDRHPFRRYRSVHVSQVLNLGEADRDFPPAAQPREQE